MRRRSRSAFLALVVSLACLGAARPVPPGERTDASTLYNAGTAALTQEAFGPAVTFLLAAARLEPRATDIRANLDRAVVDAARAAGEDVPDSRSSDWLFALSTEESWWLASAILALGALIVVLSSFGAPPRLARWGGSALVIAGVALSAWLHLQAWEEADHPEAVVVVPALSVERGPEEPSRPAVLLAAGERVRLGALRGGLIEIRIGSNRIGWAALEGVWRVADASRYTSKFEPR